MKDSKAIAKHDIKLGRCPTKLKIAEKIPRDELEALPKILESLEL